ncbi:tyrosine-protein phosphatase [Zhouia amylolytica]|uniref:tyrosine-protein phosphatase n=1 Tax=Zhouia amylolytica TaxID=376730 RepID=UPI0020CF4A27|nr:CpsB/CapC family capsule biosynthesis tyrosine phosphatase [Zhouia amylolytica]MCQ0112043.1 histidinol phosphatase [Zhouia amylolytica]
MLSIFSSKHFVADLLEDFTDIHCHLLPSLDDGAKDVNVSLKMLELYKSLGFKNIIATPHMMEDYYKLDAHKINNALETLSSDKNFDDHGIQVMAAAEHLMDQQFMNMTANKTLLPLKGNTVLVETGFISKPMQFDDMLFEMGNQGYEMVFAHPERYMYISGLKSYERIKERGCAFQLNILSLSGNYGSGVQKKAEQLLTNGMIDYIATDAHHDRHLKQLKELKVSKKLIPYLERAVINTKRDFEF